MPSATTEAAALLTLALCWACTLSASCLLVSIAPLAALATGASASLAPFTCGVFLLGAALVSAPSAPLFGAIGRRGGFLCGAAAGMLGGALGLLATLFRLPTAVVFAACGLVGLAQGMGQFYRFAALEVCALTRKPLALTLVLTGGVLAAFVGPQLAIATQRFGPSRGGGGADGPPLPPPHSPHSPLSPPPPLPPVELEDERFVGAFGAIVVLHLLNCVLSLAVCLPRGGRRGGGGGLRSAREPMLDVDAAAAAADPPRKHRQQQQQQPALFINASGGAELATPAPHERSRRRPPLLQLVSRPQCVLAIALATLTQTMMVVLMSPLAMAMRDDHFSMHVRTLTYELHFASMYAPGLLTSTLIGALGLRPTAALGVGLLGGASAVLGTGASAAHFMGGMSLCGAGWNLCFSSATLMLDAAYDAADATRVQAANDFVVFLLSAAGAFGSGYLYASHGWPALVRVAALLTALMVPLLVLAACCARRACQRAYDAYYNEYNEQQQAAVAEEWAARVTADLSDAVGGDEALSPRPYGTSTTRTRRVPDAIESPPSTSRVREGSSESWADAD